MKHHRLLIALFATTSSITGSPIPGMQIVNGADQPTHAVDPTTIETNLSVQLESCRQGLSDPLVRPEDRKRWAQLLFTLDAPPAKTLVQEILVSGSPIAQMAVFETIAERGRMDPSIFNPDWIEILLERLKSDDNALRLAAASAIAVHNSEALATRLGELAASESATEMTRLAAVEALAQHIDRRSHVRQLIGLIDLPDASITDKVFAALEPTARISPGKNSALWKQWWERKEKLSDAAWLEDRVDLYAARLAAVELELRLAREEHKRQLDAIRVHVVELQRELHRMSSPEERDARLVQWFASPLNEVRLTALSIIQARIADEGRPPDGPLRDAMLPLLHDLSVAVRRQTVLIVQNVNDVTVADALLDQLQLESEIGTRVLILKALGRMTHPQAVPSLIRETENPQSDPACIREAVLALGEIAGKLQDPALRDTIITALQARYRQLATEETSLRSALLSALATIGDPNFKTEFETALNSTNPEIIRPAIRGAKSIRLAAAVPRLRTLSSDADPLIRSAALDAIGHLGVDDADIESLLARLNPSTEANEDVRNTAWRAFRELVKRRPVPIQYALAQRLPESTDLPERFLEQLSASLETQPENEPTLDATYQRLATIFSAKKRHVEASAVLKKLYDLRIKHPNGRSTDAALLWLAAVLRSERDADAVATINLLSLAGAERIPSDRIMDTIRQYYDSPEVQSDPTLARRLLVEMNEQTPENPPPFWSDLVKYLQSKSPDESAKVGKPLIPAG